jgi:hypothetical protein
MNSAVCYYPWNLFSYECELVLGHQLFQNQSSFLFYLGIFLMTCFLESIFYFLVGKWRKLTIPKIIEQILILNLATHPVVFFVFPYFVEGAGSDVFTYIWTAELFAFVIEALILKYRYRYSWALAILTSGLANLFSWTVGIWLQVKGIL